MNGSRALALFGASDPRPGPGSPGAPRAEPIRTLTHQTRALALFGASGGGFSSLRPGRAAAPNEPNPPPRAFLRCGTSESGPEAFGLGAPPDAACQRASFIIEIGGPTVLQFHGEAPGARKKAAAPGTGGANRVRFGHSPRSSRRRDPPRRRHRAPRLPLHAPADPRKARGGSRATSTRPARVPCRLVRAPGGPGFRLRGGRRPADEGDCRHDPARHRPGPPDRRPRAESRPDPPRRSRDGRGGPRPDPRRRSLARRALSRRADAPARRILSEAPRPRPRGEPSSSSTRCSRPAARPCTRAN